MAGHALMRKSMVIVNGITDTIAYHCRCLLQSTEWLKMIHVLIVKKSLVMNG